LQKHHFPLLVKWLNHYSVPDCCSTFIIHHGDKPVGYIRYGKAPEDFQDVSSSLSKLDFHIDREARIEVNIVKDFLSSHVFSQFDACLVETKKHDKYALKTLSQAGFLTYQESGSTLYMVAKKEPEVNPLIILGSARGESNTLKAVKLVTQNTPIIDLREKDLSYFDYEYRNQNDDFLSIAEQMIRHTPLILATPVYWYSMSALMKTFMDRWSDLIDLRKDMGRRLAGKELYLITSYAGEILK